MYILSSKLLQSTPFFSVSKTIEEIMLYKIDRDTSQVFN